MNQAASESLEVEIKACGTAIPGKDYEQPPTKVIIPAGQTSTPFSVKPIDDGELEPHKTIKMEIVGNAKYSWAGAQDDPPSAAPSTQATLVDDDIVVVLVGGLLQHDNVNRTAPSADAGINGIATRLVNYGFMHPTERLHPGNIFMSSSDDGKDAQQNYKVLTRVHDEIVSRVAKGGGRTVKVALVGYSWGGGAIYQISQSLPEHAQLYFTAYIDAITLGQNGFQIENAENSHPNSDLHMNFYQSKQGFFGLFPDIHGAPTSGLNENDYETDVDVNNDATSHGKIDDLAEIQILISDNIILTR